MPPAIVKTVRDLLYWQYAKIIADSAGAGKQDYGFVMNRFKQLKTGDINWNEIREYVKEREHVDECVFCRTKANLSLEHLLPRKFNGPDTERNLVWICKSCNSSKGPRRLYEHFALQSGVEAARYDVPRIAEGKYLKLAYEVFKQKSFLSITKAQLSTFICPRCDMKPLCIRQDSEGELTPFCIDGILTICFKNELA